MSGPSCYRPRVDRSGIPAARPFRNLTRFHAAFAGLLLLAFLLRAAYVFDSWKYIPTVDAGSYDFLGRSLANGHGWGLGPSAYRPPGYPFFVAAVYLIIGVPQKTHTHVLTHFGGWTGLRMVEAGLATITVGLMGWLTMQLAGRRAALVAMLVAAVYVPFILVGVSMMTEALLVPLELAAVNCALRARAEGSGARWIVLAGLFAGLAALTRGNGIVIGVALAFVVWTAVPRWSLRSLARPGALLGVMVLTIMPWTIRNAVAQHAFVPVTTELGATLSGTYNSVAAKHHYIWESGRRYPDYRAVRNGGNGLSEAQRSSKLTSLVLTYVTKHPSAVPEAMFWNTVRILDLGPSKVWRSTAGDVGATARMAGFEVHEFWLIGLLAIVGLLSGMVRRVPRALWLVPLFIWLSEAPITTGTPRFRAALDPWFILLAGFGVLTLVKFATSLSLNRREVRGRMPITGTGARAR